MLRVLPELLLPKVQEERELREALFILEETGIREQAELPRLVVEEERVLVQRPTGHPLLDRPEQMELPEEMGVLEVLIMQMEPHRQVVMAVEAVAEGIQT